jgi:hypothetical protein
VTGPPTSDASPGRGRQIALRAASALFGVMWVWGAATLVTRPDDAYELVARAVGHPPWPKAVYAVWAAAEGGLGVAMLAGAVRGYGATGAALAAMSALLLEVRARSGGDLPCGCFALLPQEGVGAAITRNLVLAVIALALAGFAAVSDRRARRAAAAAGPATPRP